MRWGADVTLARPVDSDAFGGTVLSKPEIYTIHAASVKLRNDMQEAEEVVLNQ